MQVKGRHVQGILFDADGTLIDTYGTILASMRHAVGETLGLQLLDAELMGLVGTPLSDQMLHFAGGDAERADRAMEAYRLHNAGTIERTRAFPDTREALVRFKRAGVPMGVVTSKRHDPAVRGLTASGLSGFFAFVIGCDDWPEHNPDPGPILHGCDLLGIAPGACAYVVDSPFDIQAGAAAGCLTVAALWGMFPPEALAAERPDLTCSTLAAAADAFGVLGLAE